MFEVLKCAYELSTRFQAQDKVEHPGVVKQSINVVLIVFESRTIKRLADSLLPTTFWAKAVNTACYVQNRVLVVKPHNKTPYELFHGRTPTLSFMRPFGCPVTILNTIDHLGKFDGKADEGFFVGYSLNSKAFRVFNSRTRIVEENLHIRFSESTPNVAGSRPDWLFDIDALTRTMNYEPIVAGTQSNGFAGTKASDNAGQARKETEPVKDYILLPLWTADLPFSQDPKSSHDDGSKPSSDDGKKVDEDPRKDSESNDQEKEDNVNNTNNVNAASTNEVNAVGGKTSIKLPDDPNMPALEDYSIFDFTRNDEDDGVVADMNNLDTTIQKQKKDGIFISQDKYVDEILKKFGFTEVKTASTPMETQKPLLKDEDGEEVDVHMYRSMIGSLMYLTSSRPDIMFAVCACARYQVNPKVSHLHAVKRIFRYLKGQPKLGLWYPKDSPFDLVAYTDSDYARASLDRKSTTGGCQFLRCRLISWQCKKQTVVANSTTEAEYVTASSCYGQVLWIQNQLLDYGYNFMHTKIFIDNNRKSKKSVRLRMGKLFRMELKLILFWSTIVAKTINGEELLHALVDSKKIIITESSVRRDIQLADEKGVDFLPKT
ncbi:uncharacterized mitochondrial protein-like protein [Tanacetum coccineum]